MSKLKHRLSWAKIVIATKFFRVVFAVAQVLFPQSYRRYMHIAANSDVTHRMVHTLIIVGQMAKALGLEKCEIVHNLAKNMRGEAIGYQHEKLAARIIDAEYPARAFISAVILNGEWSRTCRYRFQQADVRALADAKIPGQAF